MSRGLYIHIPFCLRKCPYCDFPSEPLPERALVHRYLRALAEEARLRAEGERGTFDTLYIGGGTPSLLDGEELSLLFHAVGESFSLEPGAEVTIEANPATVEAERAQRFLELGVNRISLGVQSFQDRSLRQLGRIHSAEDSRRCVPLLRAAGFRNIGIDLIYGLPGQTSRDWGEDLDAALDIRPEHLSLYSLTVEKGTGFATRLAEGTLPLPPEEEVLEMYRTALEKADAAGYEHYEISNWSLPGFHSRHNRSVWAMEEYLGIGAGAHSFKKGPPPVRRGNVTSVEDYLRRIESGHGPEEFQENLPPRTLAGEALMLGLRVFEGIDRARYRTEYGADPVELFPEALNLGLEQGWLETPSNRISFTEEGIIFSDELFLRLF
jgi:oxygen-independent coproporphyrinogen-3 oxidase